MEIRIQAGTIHELKTDALVTVVFEASGTLEKETAAIDEALGGEISRLAASGEVKGKSGQQTVIFSLGKLPTPKILVLGLGKQDRLDADTLRGAVAEACRSLEQANCSAAALVLPDLPGISLDQSAQAMTEGAILGTYEFRRHYTSEAEHGKLAEVTLVVADPATVSLAEQGRKTGMIVAEAVLSARDMVNSPANYMTPTDMAAIAVKTGTDTGLEVTVLDRPQMEEFGMGALLGVAAGSDQPPKFLIMKYTGRDANETDIALVGKAITFDSGGISIKPSSGMEEMKDDMSGGAAVIAAMGAIARLKPAVNVVGLVPATENLPSGKALKPGDVLKATSGKTIEIISTDAEGRLALADAIGYARKLEAKRIVDIATLTGAMIVALGKITTGAFTNNQELVEAVIAAGKSAGEKIWQMPMFDEYKELNKSDVADVKNVGGPQAGSITAAQFLAEFVDDVPWVHLDIAGTAFSDKTRRYTVKGATGTPVRTLVNLVMSLQ